MSNPTMLVESFNGSPGVFAITGPERYDSGLWLERAGANLVVNPSLETGTTGWLGWDSATFTRETGDPQATGSYCAQAIEVGGAGKSGGTRYNLTHSTTGDFVMSCDVWLVSGASDCYITVQNQAFSTQQIQAFTATPTKQRISLALPSLAAHTSLIMLVRRASPVAGTIRVDALDLEAGLIPSSHIDGSLGGGYAWGSTAHASASTRAASSAAVTMTEPVSVACWYREAYSGAKTFAYLDTLGQLGDYGDISYAAGDLTISTSRNLVIGPFAAFDRALTATEQANLRSTQNWSMNSVNGSNIILPLSGRRRPR